MSVTSGSLEFSVLNNPVETYCSSMLPILSLLILVSCVAAQTCSPVSLNFSTMADGTSPFNLGFIEVWCGKNSGVQSGNLVLNVTQECGPDIASTLMMNSGKFEVDLATAYGSGIVTAVTLLSEGTDNKDEMDLEFVGNNMSYGKQTNCSMESRDPLIFVFSSIFIFLLVQTMYFVNGLRVPGNEAAVNVFVAADTSNSQHTYGMEFTPTALTWSVDGHVVRTINKVNGTMFPSKPMGLHLGIWDASNYSSWAGSVSLFLYVGKMESEMNAV